MAICLDALIYFGKSHYGSAAVGSSIGLTAFALMIVVAAYESRSVSRSVLTQRDFDNRPMNWIALAEIALAVMVTQMDLLQPPARHARRSAPGSSGWRSPSAVLLFVLWEVGKLRRGGARRRAAGRRRPGLNAGDARSPLQPPWLRHDVVAGLVLSTLLVPQGMAYAELAGLPAITGLYTTILCLLGYAVFGPSRILVLGPDSSLGPMIAATILPIVGSDGEPGARDRAGVDAGAARRCDR